MRTLFGSILLWLQNVMLRSELIAGRVEMSGEAQTMHAYRRVWTDLRTQILSNEFPADIALPTEAEIAKKYAVSRQTVRRAFQDLVAEDLVVRVRGRGTFASPVSGRYLRHFGTIEDLLALSEDSKLQVLTPLTARSDWKAAEKLDLPDDQVVTVTFSRSHQGEAFSHTTVYLPSQIAARMHGVEELATPGTISSVTVIGILDQFLEAPILRADQSITVSPASVEVAESLNVPLDTPLLRIDRLYFDSEDVPVELAISHFNPERYSYTIELRRNQL